MALPGCPPRVRPLVPRVSIAPGAARSTVPLVLVAVALWPVWRYLALAHLGPGGDPTGLYLLLGTVIAAIVLQRRTSQSPPAEGSPGVPVLLLAYALGYGFLPPLARAVLGLSVFGAALLGLPGVGWRERSGLLALILLAAPPPETLSFFLGGPLRAASARAAAAWLSATGVATRADGPALWVRGSLISVDAPCSGVNGLWSGLVAAALLAVAARLNPARTVLLLMAAAGLAVAANSWRTVALVHLSQLAGRPGSSSAETAHAAAGLVIFAITILLLAWLASVLSRSDGRLARAPRPLSPVTEPMGGANRWPTAALVGASLLAALTPLVPVRSAPPPPRAFPGWPARWLGQPLYRLPETPMDRRWAAATPGPLARFALADGSELLLRWVDRPGRTLHPPEDCYRGNGYHVVSVPPLQALDPPLAIHPAASLPRTVLWRRFRAERGGEAWEVRSLILSQSGESYPDPGWWWWRVIGPGATDHGPWWVVTIQNRAPGPP